MVTSIIGYILIGLLIGAIARLLVPGRNPVGIILTILIGIVGSVVGGYVANQVLDVQRWLGFVIAVVVAAILVALVSTGRRRS